MDVDVDLYLAGRLLFTVQALIFASVFERLCGAEGGRPREASAAKKAWENGAGDQESRKGEMAEKRSPEAELSPAAAEREGQAAVEPSPAAAEQQEATVVEKLSPAATEQLEGGAAAEPSHAAAKSIPQQPPAEPCKPEPQEDAGDHAALPSKAEEEDLGSDKEELVRISSLLAFTQDLLELYELLFDLSIWFRTFPRSSFQLAYMLKVYKSGIIHCIRNSPNP
ncbi:hypothetical protein AAES_165349 [Amazona aestiva]|uniref:Uncharacterized protein n=1 Tax=Amazona aestiva TaxID=12930 RepID=A0A0Q3QKW6_AMAAE|nr:hypothetical protein AAES_165349 [Amazona aestiva]